MKKIKHYQKKYFTQSNLYQARSLTPLSELDFLDYSENKIITKLNAISYSFFTETYQALQQLKVTDDWFYNKLLKNDQVYLLDMAITTKQPIKNIYDALLYCYSHQGSTLGIALLCKAIFGETASIVITSDTRGVFNISIKNALLFLSAVVSKDDSWILSRKKGLVQNIFGDLTKNTDLTRFLEQFLPTGRKINLSVE